MNGNQFVQSRCSKRPQFKREQARVASQRHMSRSMSKPTKKSQREIVSMAKYMHDLGNQRINQDFKFEALDTNLGTSEIRQKFELLRQTSLVFKHCFQRRDWWRCHHVRQSCTP